MCSYLPKAQNWPKHSEFITTEIMFPKSNFLSMCYIFLHLALDLSFLFIFFHLSLARQPVAVSTHTHRAALINTCPVSPSTTLG